MVRFNDHNHVQRGLHVCPDCGSELVQPIDWSEAPDECWNLLLSCPNCDWYTEGLYTQDQVRELEDRLDEGLADMLRDLQRLTQANMADQIDRFVTRAVRRPDPPRRLLGGCASRPAPASGRR